MRHPAPEGEEKGEEEVEARVHRDGGPWEWYDEGLLGELERVYGRHGLPRLLEALAAPPSRYYFRVNTLRADPGELLDEMRKEGYPVHRDELLEEALWIPVEGPARLRDPGCRVVVDKRAAESVMLGAHVYAPGVVRLEDCARPGREVLVVAENGAAVALGVVAQEAPAALRARRGLVVENVQPLYRVPSLRETRWWRSGAIYEQSISSMMAAHVLSPEPGSLVVDMCAAPGGKTGHVYELAGGRVRVVAVDHSRGKVERLREEVRRLGHRVEVLRADSRRLDRILGAGVADYVILDPPCSSLGVIPKYPRSPAPWS
ncbi:hypothetical protein CF15_01330 [Pyrodictium occultum]|uniref:SAM-dependent MTase RsmB/NOP-type domain-containing protein n=1 Tax=Pyrodictium occultum TaxID=2309 RepID=A0A0V8RU48_PYROC|nr:PUA domain-containing protein [Pyrodictium occultum]KSW11512.1 hypothetical protein CF15_01330 [Pyrodictium occultum]